MLFAACRAVPGGGAVHVLRSLRFQARMAGTEQETVYSPLKELKYLEAEGLGGAFRAEGILSGFQALIHLDLPQAVGAQLRDHHPNRLRRLPGGEKDLAAAIPDLELVKRQLVRRPIS